MQFWNNPNKAVKRSIAIVDGKSDPIDWPLSKLAKTKANLDVIIKDINVILGKMPKKQQTAIYELYLDFEDIFTFSETIQDAFLPLRNKICELYKHFDYQDILKYVKEESGIVHPPLKQQYDIDSPRNSVTYLYEDYIELVAFVIYLRPLVPVWGRYVTELEKIYGPKLKEYRAFKVIEQTPVTETRPFYRLVEYVDTISDGEKASMDALMHGVGTDDIPAWLLGLAIIRRLAFAEFSYEGSPESAENIVSHMYNYMTNMINENREGKAFGGGMRSKRITNAGNDDGEKSSAAEIYKMTEQISEGSILIAEKSLAELEIVKRIDPDVPMDLVTLCYKNALMRPPRDLRVGNVPIVPYVMNAPNRDVVSGHMAKLFDYDTLLRCAAIAQAVLWHWGLKELAVFCMASENAVPSGYCVGNPKSKIAPETLEQLNVLYPYDMEEFQGRNRDNVKKNPAMVTIDAICDLYDGSAWELTAPKELIESADLHRHSYGVQTPTNIKQQLAEMLIKLN